MFVCASWLVIWFLCINSVDFFMVLFIGVFYFVGGLFGCGVWCLIAVRWWSLCVFVLWGVLGLVHLLWCCCLFSGLWFGYFVVIIRSWCFGMMTFVAFVVGYYWCGTGWL